MLLETGTTFLRRPATFPRCGFAFLFLALPPFDKDRKGILQCARGSPSVPAHMANRFCEAELRNFRFHLSMKAVEGIGDEALGASLERTSCTL